MTPNQIQDALNNFTTEAQDLGFYAPRASLHINWVYGPLNLEFRIENRQLKTEKVLQTYERTYGSHYSDLFPDMTGDQLPAAFEDAFDWLRSLPTPAETREQDFLKSLADLIEQGRDLGTPVLPDLEATMKRLSHNIITKEPA